MSGRRIEMHRIQELVRLHRAGRGVRAIARELRMGRETVRGYQRALAEAELLDGPRDELVDPVAAKQALASQLPPAPAPQQRSSIEAWEPVVRSLRERGAGPTAIFDRLRVEHDDFAGSLSAIKRMCARIAAERAIGPDDVTMPVVTRPGEVAQVDFGAIGKLYDPAAGVLRRAWLFVMVLGHSRHMACRIVFDQKIETWLWLHVECFEELGGVPEVVVPDNLKSAVIRAAFGTDGEPTLNRSYVGLAREYGFRIDPTPPRAPQKKGKVERTILYVKRNFFVARDFADVNQARRELAVWLREVAGRRCHGTTGRQPWVVFVEEERETLRALPKERWDPVVWKRARVHRDCHVQVGGAFYSAPWTLVGQEVWVRVSSCDVRIHHEEERVGTHRRQARGGRATIDSHLPEERRDLRHRSRSYWMDRARAIGPETARIVDEIFESDDAILHLRRVQGIVTLLEKHPRSRAEATCRRARAFGNHSFIAIKNILLKGLDFEPLEESPPRAWSKDSRFARKPQDLIQ